MPGAASCAWRPDRSPRAERVARVYATLSMAYEAIVRIRQRLPLFERVCRVLVEQGRLRMVWVGESPDLLSIPAIIA